MKSLAHLAGFSLALVLAGLGTGCSSAPTTSRYRQPAQDFEVVETSAKRPLTAAEMAEVRASVGAFLDREGATDSGDYFLKVYLTPENVDAESEWVVVRFTRYTTQRVALVSAYTYDDMTYSPYYSYDLYPGGYGCVSRISFQYYVDPFYNRRYNYYPRHGYGRDRGHAHHGGGRPDRPDHPGGNQGPAPRPPGPPVANNPPPRDIPANANPTYPRQNPPAGGGRQHYEDIQRRWNGRPGVDAGPSGLVNAGNRTGTIPTRANNPAPQAEPDRPITAPVASQPSPGDRPTYPRQRNVNPGVPAHGGNAPRMADRANPPGNRPPQVNRQQQANRQAPNVRPSSNSGSPRPAYSNPAPARAAAPAAAQPARSAPASSGGGHERGQSSEGQRDSLR